MSDENNLTVEQKLELVAAYRAAGLHEKADALVATVLGAAPPSEAKRTFNDISAKLDATMTDLRNKLGLPPSGKKRKK